MPLNELVMRSQLTYTSPNIAGGFGGVAECNNASHPPHLYNRVQAHHLSSHRKQANRSRNHDALPGKLCMPMQLNPSGYKFSSRARQEITAFLMSQLQFFNVPNEQLLTSGRKQNLGIGEPDENNVPLRSQLLQYAPSFPGTGSGRSCGLLGVG